MCLSRRDANLAIGDCNADRRRGRPTANPAQWAGPLVPFCDIHTEVVVMTLIILGKVSTRNNDNGEENER